MKAAINDQLPIYWASIKNGKFQIYHNGEISQTSRLRGTIVGYHFKDDEYDNRKFRICLLHTIYADEKTIIAIRTDSGYFRTLCNYLTSAKAQGRERKEMIFSPMLDEKTGKKITACFLQDAELGNWYRAFHTKETATLPQPIPRQLNGVNVWDWQPVIEFYENFISTTYAVGWNDIGLQELPPLVKSPTDYHVATTYPDDLPF